MLAPLERTEMPCQRLPGEEEEAAQSGRLICGPGADSVVCLPPLFVFLPDLVVYTRTMRIPPFFNLFNILI